MNACGFFGSGFAKDQEIISKKKMMDSWSGFGYFQTLEVSCSFFFEQKSRQDFSTQDEQKGRERVSLPKASVGEKSPKGLPFIRMEKEEEKMQILI